ncbi:MAG: isoprenoid biosynthesis glyoxalase ElbB [Phycisphaerae bacterium]|nr:isoprenoid biosynthesis glyoxalase ElbB [Phycisphaerae bacterium]
MPNVAVVLSGCGRLDGSEITESICTILALAQNGAEPVFFAPNIPQAEVVNHLEQAPLAGEVRNVLLESARIARGHIADLAVARADRLDAVIFPGGQGAASNLCTFMTDGPACRVNDHVARIITEMHELGKPIGAICIAPVLVARVLGGNGIPVRVTIGNEKAVAQAIDAMGAVHVECPVDDCLVDVDHKVVTTPAYMLAKSASQVHTGIAKLVVEVLRFL